MTKTEFFLKAMISMAANPKYVNEKPAEDEPEVMVTILNVEEIAMDAERLMKAAEDYNCVFDEEEENNLPVKDTLQSIGNSLSDISDTLDSMNKEGIEVREQ
jgi:hypothetical protein